MTNIMDELVDLVKRFCFAQRIKCRVLKSQFEIAQTGTRGGYDAMIVYYTNKSAGIKLYIDYYPPAPL